jgi:hypothetical protein
MNQALPRRPVLIASLLCLVCLIPNRAGAVEALLLQDTYIDSNPTRGEPPPNESNYGSAGDLRVFKGNGQIGRAFLKFSLETLPPDTAATDVIQARLRLWVNDRSTAAGAITLSAVTKPWDEYTLTHRVAETLAFDRARLAELPITSINNFISIDVTDWVKAWLDGTLPNEGIAIEPSAATTFLDLAFDSKESTQTSHEAKLEISLRK